MGQESKRFGAAGSIGGHMESRFERIRAMEERTMWELQWLFAVTLLVITAYLGVITYVSYRVRADVERIVRSQRSYDERFNEIEDMLRYLDLQLGGQASRSLQQAASDVELHATSSDAWSQALKALDTLEDDAAHVVVENGFSVRASREQHAERVSANSARDA
jgi:hypothetical protein